MAECYDPRNAQSHLSSKATAFSIASLMASDEIGTSYTLLLSFLFSSRIIRSKLLLERQVFNRSNGFGEFGSHIDHCNFIFLVKSLKLYLISDGSLERLDS